jgi:hypothetical protein
MASKQLVLAIFPSEAHELDDAAMAEADAAAAAAPQEVPVA